VVGGWQSAAREQYTVGLLSFAARIADRHRSIAMVEPLASSGGA
jgi:hypothetical protein